MSDQGVRNFNKSHDELATAIRHRMSEHDVYSAMANLETMRIQHFMATTALTVATADVRRLRDALEKIKDVVGTSTAAWLIASKALDQKGTT